MNNFTNSLPHEYIANSAPSLFGLGVLPIYGLLLGIGFLFSFCWSYIQWNKIGYRTWDFLQLAIFVTIFSLYGAKIWYIIFDPSEAFNGIDNFLSFLTMVFIPTFGRSIIGTIIFAPIGIIIYKKIWGPDLDTLKIIDIIMPSLLLGQAIGRWGNFANHQVFGAVVDGESLNWLPSWIKNNMYIKFEWEETAQYRSPLFIYESILDILTFFIILFVFKTNDYWKKGTSGMAFFMLYGLIRTIMEPLRDPQFIMGWGETSSGWPFIPTSLISSILIMFIGLSLLLFFQYSKNTKIIILR